MRALPEKVTAGQAIYTPSVLRVYDLWVLGFSNALIWRCPTRHLLRHYRTHVSANHLEVGVGTGFFPDRCRLAPAQRLGLMDLNPNTLHFAAQRLARYRPHVWQQNILEPFGHAIQPFDSVAINYLLHCLPGTLDAKGHLFSHLRAAVRPGAVIFGATLLHEGVALNPPARWLMNLYNRKGIFTNRYDSLQGLEAVLNRHLDQVEIEVIGCAALFSGRVN